MVTTALEQAYENDIQQAARELGEQERLNLQMARAAYEEMNPMPPPWVEPVFEKGAWKEPVYEEPTFMRTMGVQSTAMTLSVIGSVALSAFTVGLILFISAVNTDVRMIEQTGNDFLNSISSIVPVLFFIGGLVAVEGYAFAHEYAQGKEKGRLSFDRAPLWAAYAIMGTTGFLRSLGLLDAGLLERYPLAKTISELGVILSLTVGLPILIGYGSRNLGVFHNQFQAYKLKHKNDFDRQRQTDYDNFLATEDERYNKFWDKRMADMEAYQTNIKAWFDGFRKYWERSYSGKVLGIDRAAPTRTQTVKPSKPTSSKGDNFTDAVRAFLKQNGWYPAQFGSKDGQTPPATLCNTMHEAGVSGFGPNDDGRKQISTYLYRLRDEARIASNNGQDWLAI